VRAIGQTAPAQLAGKTLGFAARNAPAIAGAVELAREAPVGEMMRARQNVDQANQQLANLSPQRRAWLQQHAPGVFQQANPNEAFGGGGGWGGTYSQFYGGPNAAQNIAKVINAPMNVLTFGGWEMLGGKGKLNQMAAQTDQARQQSQAGDANYQRMLQQYQQRQQQSQRPYQQASPATTTQNAQAAWTPQQMQQQIQQKQQQIAQLRSNPQAAGQVAQLQREIQWLQGMGRG